MTRTDTLKNGMEMLRKFFMGPIYPAVVGALMLASHILNIPFYLNFINIFLICLAFLVCDSVRPFVVVMCTYVFQVSTVTMGAAPDSPYYFLGGGRLVVVILLFCAVVASMAVFCVRNRIFTLENLRSLPILPAALALSVALLLNGAFSSAWSFSDVSFGAIQILSFVLIFYFFVLGFKKERGEELCSCFAYVSAIIALVVVLETFYMYLTSETLIVDGSVVKEQVLYGWGIWNTAGQQLVVTIPMIYYGVMKNKYPWFYFTVATLATGAAVLTLSRNALIFSVMAYGISAIIACFCGKRQKAFRILIPVGILLILAAAFLFREKILSILADYVSRGLSDNGRFDLWREGFDAFLKAPVLGSGFFGVYPDVPLTGDIFPWMAHNTVIEILGAMGVLGALAYGYYRFETAKVFFRKPSLEKTMLGIGILTILFGSLLDNFIFYSLPMLYYSVALAIAFHPDLNRKSEELAEALSM